MQISISSPNLDLKPDETAQIELDLEKIDRRLKDVKEVDARVRVSNGVPARGYEVTLDVKYRRNHLIAKSSNPDLGMAIREAREEILRQINDRSHGGHSSYSKGL
jgi:ribosome-associated translation inhibitor RaiA